MAMLEFLKFLGGGLLLIFRILILGYIFDPLLVRIEKFIISKYFKNE